MIIGGGLAGLTAARLLQERGVDFELFEARDRLGGRVLTVDAAERASYEGFDLGASWLWPELQPELAYLVDLLGVRFVPQYDEGDMIVQRAFGEAPQRFPGIRSEPRSMRIAGGTAVLVEALARGLPANCLRLGRQVRCVRLAQDELEVVSTDARGSSRVLRAAAVIAAMPPRLLAETVEFSPAIDPGTLRRWRETPTWMAPHAKFFALYERPFWRDADLSGEARSVVGPLAEIHDATMTSGPAALFGFLALDAKQRLRAGRSALIDESLRQLSSMFGSPAREPMATLFKDWAADPFTATTLDQSAGDHPISSALPWVARPWDRRLALAGSETSRLYPGYLAGAVDAARQAVNSIVSDR